MTSTSQRTLMGKQPSFFLTGAGKSVSQSLSQWQMLVKQSINGPMMLIPSEVFAGGEIGTTTAHVIEPL